MQKPSTSGSFAFACNCILCILLASMSSAQEQTSKSKAAKSGSRSSSNSRNSTEPSEYSPSYTAPKQIEMLIGLSITPIDGNLIETTAQTVFPTDWPEQTVEIIEQTVPPNLQLKFRDMPGNNRQLLVYAPVLAPGTVQATVRVRVEKKHIVGPEDTSRLIIPKRLPSSMKQFMGSSPYIDPGLAEIKKVAKQIADSNPLTDWKRVEMLYDWVRENIVYENGELKTVAQALKDRKGDCEEMTGIFIALCRASRVPARCVWIPNHCYPEFYLEDDNGDGHWFPCQAAGTRNFGSMPEYLPILQKGDRFKVPERPEQLRYLADFLSSSKNMGKKNPQVEFIRQLLGDAAQLPTPDLGGSANLIEAKP